ncbi:MAG: sterol desaturase family protein [Acidimicrobiaceae bacterium]|nr:sterol desaturase family protein [Acidimicrobiaceae bacterium]
MAVVTSEKVAPPGAVTAGRPAVTVTSRVYLPAVALAGVAVALIAVGAATSWGGIDFAASLSSLRLTIAGPVALAILGVILVAERVRPAQRRPLVARGARQDVLYTVLHATLGALLITALSLSFQEVLRRVAPWIVLPKMGLVPHGLAVAVIFVGMDACNWFVHLLNHRVRVLWRFHELHHSQEDLNALSVFRTHPLIAFSYLLALVPGLLLLANGALSVTLLVIYGGIVAFAHSNTNLGFGPLRRVFVSPNYHRIHHRLVGAQDVNLGFALTVWDQLARRAVFPTPETVRIDTGIPGRPLRVEQEGPRPRHLAAFTAQLLGPFRPMPEPVDLPSIRTEARVIRSEDRAEDSEPVGSGTTL